MKNGPKMPTVNDPNICNVEMITIIGPYNIHVLCEILREIYIFSEMY